MTTDAQADALKTLEETARQLEADTRYRDLLIYEAYMSGAAVADIAHAAMIKSRTTIYNILKRRDR